MQGKRRRWLVGLALVLLVGSITALNRAGRHDPTNHADEPGVETDERSRSRGDRERTLAVEAPGQPVDAPQGTILIQGLVKQATEAGPDLPLPGATVELRPRMEAIPPELTARLNEVIPDFTLAPPPEAIAEATTDAEGKYEITAAHGGPWIVVASAEGFATDCLQPDPESPITNFVLEPEHRRTLRVVAKDGTPLADARVTLFANTYVDTAWSTPFAQLVTNGSGAFTVVGDVDWLLVRADGFAWAAVRRPYRRASDRVVLASGRPIVGTVVDPAGLPVPGAAVALSRFTGLSERHEGQVCGANGQFHFQAVDPSDETYLEVAAIGWPPVLREVRAGETELRIVLSRPGSVSGRVCFPGEGVVRVRLGRRERWSDPTTRRECASDGSFAFSGLAPGRYRLRASRTTEIEFEGNRFEYTEHEVVLPISLAPGDEVSGVELKPESQPLSWVALRIVDASGEPVEGVIAWSDANPRVPQGQERMSDEDGIVLLPLAVPAQTRVRIDLSFPAKEIAGEAVDHSEAIERLTSSMDSLRLEQLHLPEVVHEVTILGADGGPLDPDDIFGPELRGPGWVVALPDGTLKAAHPPGAGLKLRLSVSGHPRQEVSFTADECRAGGPLTATLVGGVTVRGRIVAPDGLPFAGNAVLRSGSPYGGERNLEPDGSFEFRRVARGPLVIAATLSRDARLEAAWGFHTNSEDVLDVGELRVGGRFRGTVTVEGADDGSGTSVVIAERRWRRYVPEFARTTTAADGSFSLAAIAVPDAQLEVRRKGFAPVILRVGDLDPGTLIAVHLDERPGSLRIRLEPAPSRSAGLQFFVRNAESTARFLRRGFRRAARSPEWGKSATYEIDDPPAGAFVLECETKDYASFDVTGSVHVEAGRTDEVVLRLTRE